jgi:hypothetical protein
LDSPERAKVLQSDSNIALRHIFLSDFQPSILVDPLSPRAALPFRALALGYVLAGLTAPFALSGQLKNQHSFQLLSQREYILIWQKKSA